MKNVAVFVSGGGSNLQSIIDYQGQYNIGLVISDRELAFGLERAKNHNIPAVYIGKKNTVDMDDRISKIIEVLQEHNIDVIVLAGYLSIMPKEITDLYENAIINIHPSLIPSFCGMGYYGEKVHQGVYDSGVKVTGATVHFVDDKVDTGAIIVQESVAVDHLDTPDSIAKKVLKIEHKILAKALEDVCLGNVRVENNRTIFK